ncbi:hypothetical protein C6341_g23557 [Phytophthora cactorum]|nr:hypothetical protein C6341_g23557 [Phytophthora cactorum]KAG4043623.1 hypothetical protein PC123_g20904 [Phytophthora cactorum]
MPMFPDVTTAGMGDVGAGVNDADFEGVGEGAPK